MDSEFDIVGGVESERSEISELVQAETAVGREREERGMRAEIEFDDGFVVNLVNVFKLGFEDANGTRRLHGGDGGREGAG